MNKNGETSKSERIQILEMILSIEINAYQNEIDRGKSIERTSNFLVTIISLLITSIVALLNFLQNIIYKNITALLFSQLS